MDDIVIFDKDYVKLYMTVDEFVETETKSGKYSYIINGTTVKEDDLRLAVNGEIVSIWGIWEDDEYHYLKYTDEHTTTTVTMYGNEYTATTFVDSASNEYYAIKESDRNPESFYPHEMYCVCTGDTSNVQQFDQAILVSGVTEPSIIYPNSNAGIVPLTGLTICLNDWTDNKRFLGKTFTTDKEIVTATRSGNTSAFSAMVFTCNETHETVYAEVSSWGYEQYGDIFGSVTFYTGASLDAVVDCGNIDRTVIVKNYPRHIKSDEPCAAYIDETDEVIFNYTPPRLYHIRATYNVTTTNEPTRISWRYGGIQTATFKAILDDETVIWDDIPDSEYQNGEGYQVIVNNGMGSSYQFETTGLHTIDFYYNFDVVKIFRGDEYNRFNDYTVPLMAFADSPALTEVEFFEGIEGFDFSEVFGSGWYSADVDTGLTAIRLPKGFMHCSDGSNWNTNFPKIYYAGTLNEYLQIDFYRNFFGTGSELYCDGQLISGNLVIDGTNKSLDYASFNNYSLITSVTFQEGVEHIISGFSNCDNLVSISLPSTLQSIGDYTFANNYSLQSITIPANLSAISENAFSYCYQLSSVTFSSAVDIGYNAFLMCTALTSLNIPENSIIRPQAFSNCHSLKSVVLGENVVLADPAKTWQNTGNYFSGCTGITSITIPNSITSIPQNAFPNKWLTGYCPSYGNIYYPNDVVAYKATSTSISACTFKDGTVSISPNAFYGCGLLRNVTIPAGVKSIPSYCFYNCSRMTGVTFLGESIESFDAFSFYGCSGLTSIVIPNGTAKLKDRAFYGCKSLSSITVPDSVIQTEYGVFSETPFLVSGYCPSDGNIYYPNNSVAYMAVNTSITTCTLKPTTKYISYGCFRNCTGLTNVEIPSSVTYIDSYAFSKCTGLTNITIPDSVTGLNGYCFENCYSLTSITFSNSLTEIPNRVLQGSYSLRNATIPNNVEVINEGCFYACSGLTAVTLGESLKTISGGSNFSGCTSLSQITSLAEKAPVTYYNAFSSLSPNGTLYYPEGSDYRSWGETLKWTLVPIQ